MSITVLSPGVLTTVQDRGRFGYQQYGISACGVMDPHSAALANILVGNPEDEAVLEFTLMGPHLKFHRDIAVAMTGADLSPTLDGIPMPMYQAVHVFAGQILRCLVPKTGCRAYLAFAGGLDIPVVMGSRSTDRKAHLGGVEGRPLKKWDEIAFRNPFIPDRMEIRSLPREFAPRSLYPLRVILGPQEDAFTEEGMKTFLSGTYTVTQESDRMGCRLKGPAISHIGDGNIISDGIAFGAIQVPAQGQPIIMLADRQTVGGYAKIANVITADFRLLAQLKPGDRVCFQPVSIQTAQNTLLAQRAALRALSAVNR